MRPKLAAKVRAPLAALALLLLGTSSPLKAESISPSTYKKLTEIQELMSNNQLSDAVQELKALAQDQEEDSLSNAIVLQTWGYAEMASNRYPQAIDKFRHSLALNKLPEKASLNIRYMMAQLYAGSGEFAEALTEAEIWYQALPEPKPNDHMFLANITAQLKQYAKAEGYALQAITQAEEVKESWYQLLLAAQFEQKHYPDALKTLKQMLSRWPASKTYWEQLASVHMLLEQETEALAVLQLAWKQNFLDRESSIISLAQLTVSQGLPEPAARLLAAALQKELISRNEKHLGMLAGAWEQAREKPRAVTAYGELAQLADDGAPLLKQARLLIELERWQDAQQSLQQALDKGLDKADKAWLLLGIAQIQSGQLETGKATLQKARAFSSVKSQANAWINFASQRREYENWKSSKS
ncbi:hypothetical protein DXV75_01930 [Alteromonas aestuariivivens]|uniref:Uncharacterized protein n=1 Tax=Alteromonas aestuariivivens TaxID=1938339 RepID=A0A3D8MF95_9ALTE|nr:tetratricopeptide repeat protein [Alteromonas aestuariivivens]RDV29241.1 hypothetical protein DXV75_01930 [Alteromonas aestuariivivens]